MTLLRRIKGFVVGLMVLAAVCLVVEQLAYFFGTRLFLGAIGIPGCLGAVFSCVFLSALAV